MSLKFQVLISSASPHALAELLLSLPDDTGDMPTYEADDDQPDGAVATADAPKSKRGRKPKADTAVPVSPPINTDVSGMHPGVQALAGVVAAPPITAVPLAPAAPQVPIAPASAPMAAIPAPPPAAVPSPIPTPAEPTFEQLKDAMTILLSKVPSPMEAQGVLKKYTGFGSLVDLTTGGKEWAPIAHYVLTNYPDLPESVQPRAV